MALRFRRDRGMPRNASIHRNAERHSAAATEGFDDVDVVVAEREEGSPVRCLEVVDLQEPLDEDFQLAATLSSSLSSSVWPLPRSSVRSASSSSPAAVPNAATDRPAAALANPAIGRVSDKQAN